MTKKQRVQNAQYYYPEDYDGSSPLKNKQQEKFCREYIKDFKQADAVRRAGYTGGPTARRTAYRLMTYDYVRKRIEYLNQESEIYDIVTVKYIVRGLKNIAEKGDLTSRVRAFELLGKHLNMFVDRKEITIKPKRIVIRSESGEVEEELG